MGNPLTPVPGTLTGNRIFTLAFFPAVNPLLAVEDGHIQSQQATVPTIAANSLGTTRVVGPANATGIAGEVSITPDAGAATGTVTLTFDHSYATAPIVVMTPTNANAALLGSVYVAATATDFPINFAAAPTTSTTHSHLTV